MLDECVLLRTVENNHMTTCEDDESASRNTRLFIEKYIPDIRKSKVLVLLMFFSESQFHCDLL